MATGLYHGSLSYARDTALFASKYFGGIHGPEDMSLSDIYSAPLDAGSCFTRKTDNWMESSPYASGDLYQFTRLGTYEGLGFANSFLLPHGKLKLLTSTGKALHKAGKAAQRSQKLLKSRLLTSKLFKSSGQGSKYLESALQGHLLKTHLRQLEKYGSNGYRKLSNGRIRYYSKITPARQTGKMAGRRRVREWNPQTGLKRTWHETLDYNRKVRVVRPQKDNMNKIHYFFDDRGKFIGAN